MRHYIQRTIKRCAIIYSAPLNGAFFWILRSLLKAFARFARFLRLEFSHLRWPWLMISGFGHEFFSHLRWPQEEKREEKREEKKKGRKKKIFLKTPARLPLKSDAWGVKKVFPPTRRGKRDSICPLVARIPMRNKGPGQRKSRFLHEILPDFAIFFGANFLHFPSYFKCVCAFFAFCALFALWIFAFTLALINDFGFWSRFFLSFPIHFSKLLDFKNFSPSTTP